MGARRGGRTIPRALLLALTATALLAPAAPGSAAGAPPEFSAEIRVGFGGLVTPDAWIPVTVRLRSARDFNGVLEVSTRQARPPSVERVRLAVHLTAGAALPLTAPAIVRDLHTPVVLRLLEDGAVRARWAAAIPSSRLAESVVLALSARPLGLQQLLGEGGRVRVAYVQEEELPGRWQLYEGVAAVVIRDLAGRRLVPSQAEALAGWVAAGGRILIAVPTPEVPVDPLLRPFLSAPELPPLVPDAPERRHRWGRGRIVVVPGDPFRADLPPEEEVIWTRVLGEPQTPPFVDARALAARLPQSGGTPLGLQVLVVAALGIYLLLLRPMTRALLGGRAGWILAAALLLGVTTAMVLLNAAIRRGAATLAQGAIAVALPDQERALVESVGHAVVPRRGPVRLETRADALIRVLPGVGADTTLIPDEVARFEGRAAATLPVRAASLIPLSIRGSYRDGPEGTEVRIENRTGRSLRHPVAFRNGQVQPLPPLDGQGRATLSPLRWSEPPDVEGARGPAARALAWTFGRLRDDAILSPTVYVVAWLDDDRGVLHGPEQPAVPLLLVLPLTPAAGGP